MAQFEYKVVPAPARGEKVRGVKEPEMRFANTVEGVLNMMAQDGWEFVRAEMLPSEERSGLSRTSKEWRNLLIFKREKSAASHAPEPPVAKPEEVPSGPRIRTPMAKPAEPESRGRALARQVRGPIEPDAPDDGPAPVAAPEPEEPFEVRSVDDAAAASPFRSWRERS